MYIEPNRIQSELARRRRDKGLMAAVEEFIGGTFPDGWPADRPIATLDRYLATARVEDIVFSHAARSLSLRPYWPTYLAERFTTVNPEKVSCLRPRIQTRKLQFTNNWLVKSHLPLVGQPLGTIQVNGSSLTEVHAEARKVVLDEDIVDNVFDISNWLHQQAYHFGAESGARVLAPFYYNATMALNVCHGVLFEDYDGGPNEKSGLGQFVDNVVKPAIQLIRETFGLSPLIMRLPYVPGFLEFPPATEAVFNRHREQ